MSSTCDLITNINRKFNKQTNNTKQVNKNKQANERANKF